VNHGMYEQRANDIDRLRSQTSLFVVSDSELVTWHKQRPPKEEKKEEEKEKEEKEKKEKEKVEEKDKRSSEYEKDEKNEEKQEKRKTKHKAASASKYGKRPDDSITVRHTKTSRVFASFRYTRTVEDEKNGKWYTLLSDDPNVAAAWP